MEDAANLDELHLQIIDYLRHHGRAANTEIARHLGVSEATVRNRIQNLVSDNVIQIVAVTNPTKLGITIDVALGITCDPGAILATAEALAAMDEIRFISLVSGRYDIFAEGLFRTKEDLCIFLTDRLGSIPGVRKAEPLHQLRVIKRGYEYWMA